MTALFAPIRQLLQHRSALLWSVAIHLVVGALLWLSWSPPPPAQQEQESKPVMEATIVFVPTPSEPPPVIEQPEPVQEPEPVEEPEVELPEPEEVAEAQPEEPIEQPAPQQPVEEQVAVEQPTDVAQPVATEATNQPIEQASTPTATFSPRDSIDSYIQDLNSDYVEGAGQSAFQPGRVPASSGQWSPQSGPVKPLLETIASPMPGERVVRYGSGCMLIKLEKDHNGATRERWLPTNDGCNFDKLRTEQQLKQSLAKFIRKKPDKIQR